MNTTMKTMLLAAMAGSVAAILPLLSGMKQKSQMEDLNKTLNELKILSQHVRDPAEVGVVTMKATVLVVGFLQRVAEGVDTVKHLIDGVRRNTMTGVEQDRDYYKNFMDAKVFVEQASAEVLEQDREIRKRTLAILELIVFGEGSPVDPPVEPPSVPPEHTAPGYMWFHDDGSVSHGPTPSEASATVTVTPADDPEGSD